MGLNKSFENKKIKEEKLLNSAYKLFTKNSVNDTSIQDIVDDAGVGKGTFYLYFRNKNDIKNKLIISYSNNLFKKAIENLNKNYITDFDDSIIFIINYIITELSKNHVVLNFISRDLTLGLINGALTKISASSDDSEMNLFDFFSEKAKNANKNYEDPDVILYTIIEFVGSTALNSILNNKPKPIEEYKPILYKYIRQMLN